MGSGDVGTPPARSRSMAALRMLLDECVVASMARLSMARLAVPFVAFFGCGHGVSSGDWYVGLGGGARAAPCRAAALANSSKASSISGWFTSLTVDRHGYAGLSTLVVLRMH